MKATIEIRVTLNDTKVVSTKRHSGQLGLPGLIRVFSEEAELVTRNLLLRGAEIEAAEAKRS